MSARTNIQWDSDAQHAGNNWLSYLVFPGGAAGMDAAIQALARPLTQPARDLDHDHWFFQRGSDERGPHLRVRIHPRVGHEEALRRRYERLIAACLADVREPVAGRRQPLLPTARNSDGAAHHGAYRSVYLRELERYGGSGGTDRAERVFEVSSRMAVGVLPLLVPARSRAGFALKTMEATIDVALAPADRRAFWSRYVRYWIGGDTPSGQGRRTALARQAAAMGSDLRAVGDTLRTNPGINELVLQYLRVLARALEQEVEFGPVRPDGVVFDHVHLTNNRIGISPVEETLLAIALLQSLGEPAPRPTSHGSISRPVVRAEPDVAAVRDNGRDIAVELRDVSKSYGNLEALRGVSLSVRSGEVFGLVGPNGAGKTTLVECIVGLRTATSGMIRVLGTDPRENRSALLSRIGIQPQRAELFTHLTAGEILDLWCTMFPNSPGVGTILRRVSLEEKADARVSQLSGGQRKRLVLGLALASDPELLFLDEPSANLDVEAREELHVTIRALRDDRRTVIIATHDMEEAEKLCDRLAILVSGRVEDCDTPDHLVNAWLPEQTVAFRVASRPARELLERLEGASSVDVSADGQEWEVRIKTMRPDELLADIAGVAALAPQAGVRLLHRGLGDAVLKAMHVDGAHVAANAVKSVES